MSGNVVINKGSQYTLTSAVPALLNVPMVSRKFYLLTVTSDTLFNQGAAPVASAANGSSVLTSGQSIILDGGNGAQVSVLMVSVTGTATLTPITVLF